MKSGAVVGHVAFLGAVGANGVIGVPGSAFSPLGQVTLNLGDIVGNIAFDEVAVTLNHYGCIMTSFQVISDMTLTAGEMTLADLLRMMITQVKALPSHLGAPLLHQLEEILGKVQRGEALAGQGDFAGALHQVQAAVSSLQALPAKLLATAGLTALAEKALDAAFDLKQLILRRAFAADLPGTSLTFTGENQVQLRLPGLPAPVQARVVNVFRMILWPRTDGTIGAWVTRFSTQSDPLSVPGFGTVVLQAVNDPMRDCLGTFDPERGTLDWQARLLATITVNGQSAEFPFELTIHEQVHFCPPRRICLRGGGSGRATVPLLGDVEFAVLPGDG